MARSDRQRPLRGRLLTMSDRPTYQLDFEALPDPVPAVLRLRRLLKYALRAAGFRCVRHAELKPGDSDGPAETETCAPKNRETP